MKEKNKNSALTGFLEVLCVLTLLASLAVCASGPDGGMSARKGVTDGTYVTTGVGRSETTLMTVSTTFTNNRIVDIQIGTNSENDAILDTVKTLLIPRIIESQSLGIDIITGATFSSLGLKQAVSAAIETAGGKSDEWDVTIPKKSGTVKLEGYDVIVVGLGGSGTAAYAKASEPVNGYYPAVYGIESAGKIGGTSATTGGPMAINSEYLKNQYTQGRDYAIRNALLKEWYADMEADVPDNEIPALVSFVNPFGTTKGKSYPLPNVTKKTPAYQGGPKWQLIRKLVDESGETVTWLAQNYNFHFCAPRGLAYEQYMVQTYYGKEEWDESTNPPGYREDFDFVNHSPYRTIMFTRAVETAKNRNPKSGYKLELRATDLIMSNGKVAGVKAVYRDGTIYEIYGKTVILATGGFIANRSMTMEYFGAALNTEAVDTSKGAGILMAVSDANAGTYNISMPAMVHIVQIKNIIRDILFSNETAKDTKYKTTLTSMLLKEDNLVVGLKDMPQYDLSLAGKRFSNESLPTMVGSLDFEIWQGGGHCAAIFSQDEITRIRTAGTRFAKAPLFLTQGNPPAAGTPIPEIEDILAVGEQRGNVIKAATLNELARKLGIPEAVFTATVAAYNSYVGNKEDSEFKKAAEFLVTPVNPNDTAYYAVLGAGYYYTTNAGLDVDEDIQVLDTNRQKIPGLYAVGMDSAGVLFNAKKAYVGYGAAAQGWALTSGRIAAQAAVKAALGK
jgi:uncharacterized protein with FMN-binding domain